jgi:holliday junction DNA helicase RuvA
MIGKLKGKVDAVGESHLVIDVHGVGYEVQASTRTLRNLKPGDDVTLTIDTHVREDAIRLFGFQSEFERSWFRTLQTIQGVGAKVALSVLGVMAATGGPASPAANVPPGSLAFAEALSALTNLGYNPAQANAAVVVAAKELGETADTAGLIKRSLKELAR